jgi:hypothetical protein
MLAEVWIHAGPPFRLSLQAMLVIDRLLPGEIADRVNNGQLLADRW